MEAEFDAIDTNEWRRHDPLQGILYESTQHQAKTTSGPQEFADWAFAKNFDLVDDVDKEVDPEDCEDC